MLLIEAVKLNVVCKSALNVLLGWLLHCSLFWTKYLSTRAKILNFSFVLLSKCSVRLATSKCFKIPRAFLRSCVLGLFQVFKSRAKLGLTFYWRTGAAVRWPSFYIVTLTQFSCLSYCSILSRDYIKKRLTWCMPLVAMSFWCCVKCIQGYISGFLTQRFAWNIFGTTITWKFWTAVVQCLRGCTKRSTSSKSIIYWWNKMWLLCRKRAVPVSFVTIYNWLDVKSHAWGHFVHEGPLSDTLILVGYTKF